MPNGNDLYYPTPIAGGDNAVISNNQVVNTYPGVTIRTKFIESFMSALIVAYGNSPRSSDLLIDTATKYADDLIKSLKHYQ